jgi:hypothetical protein
MPNQPEMVIHQFAGAELPRSPAFQRLEGALLAAADALAGLSIEEFEALAHAEAADLPLVFEYFEATGWPTMFPPERWLGHQILEFYAQRYPLLATDGDGTA